MMKTGRAGWIVIGIVTALLLAVLLALYLRTRHADEREHQEHVSALRLVGQLDAQAELDVLKLRTGLAVDYDTLTSEVDRTTQLVQKVCDHLADEVHDDNAFLDTRCAALHLILVQKAGLVERFKSAHSVLHNSLAFLPTAAAEAHIGVETMDPVHGAGRSSAAALQAAGAVDELLLGTLLFVQHATADQADALGMSLKVLEGLASRLPGQTRDHTLTFIAHVRVILREQLDVDGLLTQIASLPSNQAMDEISNVLQTEQQSVIADAQRDRLYLLMLTSVLVALLLYAATRLIRNIVVIRQSNDQLVKYGQGLEVLVADRVAELRESEANMARLARYDALTGLPNRHLFQDRLREAMARADRDHTFMALMFVDLDHFKQINDSLGHAVGDGVLQAVGMRLRDTMRDMDTVARLGGDEFTIICEGLADESSAAQIASKVKEALGIPIVVDGRTFTVSASIGVAIHTMGSDDRDSLLRAADIAMYRAKDRGRNAYEVFVPEMAVQVTRRVSMEMHLRLALELGEFALVYQPKVDLATGSFCGVEALLRWNNSELGSVSPVEFIPIAEEMGLIVAIGEWVLEAACTQAAQWRSEGMPPLFMAVNLSPRELKDPRLINRIDNVLRLTGLPAEYLELELTEGVVMDDIHRSIETLSEICDLGVRIAVDDFGTGYSSLAYLSRLPIHILKIDRALITPMVDDPVATTLVSTIVTLAHSLHLEVVAEGVETDAQRTLLRSLRCDQLQGYLFSKPVPSDVLARLVQANVAEVAASAPAFLDPTPTPVLA